MALNEYPQNGASVALPYRAGQTIPSAWGRGWSPTRALTANRWYAQYLDLHASQTLASLRTYVSGTASTNIRAAVYADDGTTYPGDLLVDAGVIDASTTGYKSLAGLATSLSAQRLWISWISDGAPPILTSATGSRPETTTPLGEPHGLAGYTNYGWFVAGTYGAAPATFPAGGTIMQTNNIGEPWYFGAEFS